MDAQNTPKKVVVCGGGVIGVCTAYFLSKGGAAFTLVEKSSIACADCGKASGFLALDWCDGGSVGSLARASFNLHRSLVEEINGAELYGYRPVTTLSLLVTESTTSSERSNMKPSCDVPSWVDGPAKGPRTVGMVEMMAQVHPQLFTQTLLYKAVEEYGVKVVIKKMEAMNTSEGGVTSVVLEDDGHIEADFFVAVRRQSITAPLCPVLAFLRCYARVSAALLASPSPPSTALLAVLRC